MSWAWTGADTIAAATRNRTPKRPPDRLMGSKYTRGILVHMESRLNVNSDFLEKAREVHRRQRETWLAENREAIAAYNEHVTQHGVFSAGLRGF